MRTTARELMNWIAASAVACWLLLACGARGVQAQIVYVADAPRAGGVQAAEPYVDADFYYDSLPPDLYQQPVPVYEPWTWQWLPDGLIYHSYLAGAKEPRISGQLFREQSTGWRLDATLGGRAGLFRYGTTDDEWPNGWQLDIEGAAFPRLDLDIGWELVSADFRIGFPLTYGAGPWRFKFAYYHLSSHLGDELIIREPDIVAERLNFSRDAVALGISYYIVPALRLYAEAAYAFHIDGGTKPWEFQFGVDFSPVNPNFHWGAPFFAINGHLREEVNFGGNVTVQTGWQFRGQSGHLFRIGAYYFNGQSNQFEFFREHEQQVGMGMWYDY